MFFNLIEVIVFFVGHLDVIIFFLTLQVLNILLFFDFVMIDFESLVESLQDFGQLFFLCVSEFFILNELLELLDE
jgi:hypothetical protein